MSNTSRRSVDVRQRPQLVATVDDEGLTAAFNWVVNIATPEQVAWNAPELADVRSWLKAHKAATDLRIKATRLEMIALRKVAMAGLGTKLSGAQRTASAWLAELDDEAFAGLLADVTQTDTPEGLRRRSLKEKRDVESHLQWAHVQSGQPLDDSGEAEEEAAATWQQSGQHLNYAVNMILGEISSEGESFTVAQAADALAVALGNEDIHVPQELTAEPLREVVRRALRATPSRNTVMVNADREPVRMPAYVTYTEAAIDGYVRVPWDNAGIEQFRQSVAMRAAQVEQVQRRLEQAQRLLAVLDRVHAATGENGCAALANRAAATGLLLPARGSDLDEE